MTVSEAPGGGSGCGWGPLGDDTVVTPSLLRLERRCFSTPTTAAGRRSVAHGARGWAWSYPTKQLAKRTRPPWLPTRWRWRLGTYSVCTSHVHSDVVCINLLNRAPCPHPQAQLRREISVRGHHDESGAVLLLPTVRVCSRATGMLLAAVHWPVHNRMSKVHSSRTVVLQMHSHACEERASGSLHVSRTVVRARTPDSHPHFIPHSLSNSSCLKRSKNNLLQGGAAR